MSDNPELDDLLRGTTAVIQAPKSGDIVPLVFKFKFNAPSKSDRISNDAISGVYVKWWTFVIYSDEQNTMRKYLVNFRTPEPEGDPYYKILYPAYVGARYDTDYSVEIPKGTLQSNTKYYWRVVAEVVVGEVLRGWPNEGKLRTGPAFTNYAGEKVGYFQTEANLPEIDFYVNPKYALPLPEFGGEVELKWVVNNSTKVFIRPSDIDGLGNVSNDATAKINITRTTTFLLEAENENGKSTKTVTVEVISTGGIRPEFNSDSQFNSDNLSAGDLVAQPGDMFTLQLYTENILDANLFIAYPIFDSTRGLPFTKYIVTPDSMILKSESTINVPIRVPDIDGKFPPEGRLTALPKDKIISGSWGYDSKGEDGVFWRKIGGYFKLLGK